MAAGVSVRAARTFSIVIAWTIVQTFVQTIAALSLLAAVPIARAAVWTFDGVDRVVAISDVHGDYDAMVTTLTNAGVLDESLGWAGGASHLTLHGQQGPCLVGP